MTTQAAPGGADADYQLYYEENKLRKERREVERSETNIKARDHVSSSQG